MTSLPGRSAIARGAITTLIGFLASAPVARGAGLDVAQQAQRAGILLKADSDTGLHSAELPLIPRTELPLVTAGNRALALAASCYEDNDCLVTVTSEGHGRYGSVQEISFDIAGGEPLRRRASVDFQGGSFDAVENIHFHLRRDEILRLFRSQRVVLTIGSDEFKLSAKAAATLALTSAVFPPRIAPAPAPAAPPPEPEATAETAPSAVIAGAAGLEVATDRFTGAVVVSSRDLPGAVAGPTATFDFRFTCTMPGDCEVILTPAAPVTRDAGVQTVYLLLDGSERLQEPARTRSDAVTFTLQGPQIERIRAAHVVELRVGEDELTASELAVNELFRGYLVTKRERPPPHVQPKATPEPAAPPRVAGPRFSRPVMVMRSPRLRDAGVALTLLGLVLEVGGLVAITATQGSCGNAAKFQAPSDPATCGEGVAIGASLLGVGFPLLGNGLWMWPVGAALVPQERTALFAVSPSLVATRDGARLGLQLAF